MINYITNPNTLLKIANAILDSLHSKEEMQTIASSKLGQPWTSFLTFSKFLKQTKDKWRVLSKGRWTELILPTTITHFNFRTTSVGKLLKILDPIWTLSWPPPTTLIFSTGCPFAFSIQRWLLSYPSSECCGGGSVVLTLWRIDWRRISNRLKDRRIKMEEIF